MERLVRLLKEHNVYHPDYIKYYMDRYLDLSIEVPVCINGTRIQLHNIHTMTTVHAKGIMENMNDDAINNIKKTRRFISNNSKEYKETSLRKLKTLVAQTYFVDAIESVVAWHLLHEHLCKRSDYTGIEFRMYRKRDQQTLYL